ncbi:MAG: molecular chaperone HscB [Maribacter sp.]|jgi:molecular chaperone HscB
MNYFEFYQTPISFKVDARALKRKFYALSKEYHPDFHTDKPEEEQARILELSSLNNKAYNTLKDFDLRMKYVLNLKDLLHESSDKLPQSFLMEMMDVNEVLMDLEFDEDTSKLTEVKESVNQMKISFLDEVSSIIDNYDDTESTDEELSLIKNYYLKQRYILRIQDNLNKFASA